MPFFDKEEIEKNFEKAKKSNSKIQTFGYGALGIGKMTVNLILKAGISGAEAILSNPNATPESRSKAQDFLSQHKNKE